MELRFRFRNLDPAEREALRAHTEDQASRHLDGLPAPLRERDPQLVADLARDPHHGAYEVSLRLTTPGDRWVAHARDFDSEAAVRRAMLALKRQLRKHGTETRSRHERLHELRGALGALDSHERQNLGRFLESRLNVLTKLAQRELEFLRAEDRLDEAYPDVIDVVDEALLRAIERVSARSPTLGLDTLIHQSLAEVLAEAVVQRQIETALRHVRFTHDDALRDFDPEEALAETELRRLVRGRVRHLPSRWRQALLLRTVQDLSPEAIAQVLQMSTAGVDEALHCASAFLREALWEAGFPMADLGDAAEYVIPLAAEPATELVEQLQSLVRTAAAD